MTVNWWLLICGFSQPHELRSSRRSTPVDNQRHEQGTVDRVRGSLPPCARQPSPLCGTVTSAHADHTFTCSEGQRTRSVGITPLLFGCSAGGSPTAHQSTRNGDNAEVFLKHVGNYGGQPQQRSHASHRPADGHHSCLSTFSTGDRSQGHRTTHGWLQHSWLPPHRGRQPSDSWNEHALRTFGCESRQCHITPGG